LGALCGGGLAGKIVNQSTSANLLKNEPQGGTENFIRKAKNILEVWKSESSRS
jgi:hypothetical protein